MEDIVACDICAQQFDTVHFVPKMLECGHTFCSRCLSKVFQGRKTCPNCRCKIKGSEMSIPVNYIVLKTVDIYKSKKTSDDEMVTSIDVMKKKCIYRKEVISKQQTEMSSSVQILQECIDRLDDLTLPVSMKPNLVKKVLHDVCKKVKKTDAFIRCDDVKGSVSILLANFENPTEYLTEIYKKVQNDEKVFAAHKVGEEAKYGKVSWYGNKLYFHSLSNSEVPACTSLIWFDELKECTNNQNFSTFINVCCNERGVSRILTFKMLDKEKSHSFIKLCSGEYGPCYKGTLFEKGEGNDISESVMLVRDFVENGRQSSRVLDYNFCDQESEIDCEIDQLYLYTYERDSGFQIFLATEKFTGTNPIIGKVTPPVDLTNSINYAESSFLKILDCGIVLDV